MLKDIHLLNVIIWCLCFGGGCTDAQVVTKDAAAPCQDQDPTRCYRGAAFVECPGPDNPVAYCSTEEDGGCLWVSNGCPLGSYTVKLTQDCSCDARECAPLGAMEVFTITFGHEAWGRNREMNVAVSIEPSAGEGKDVAVTCRGEAPTCTPRPNLCCEAYFREIGERWELHNGRDMPGTFIEVIQLARLLEGWNLMIEIDGNSTPPRARACRTGFTDAPNCGKSTITIDCAEQGQLTLNALPQKDYLSSLRGTFSLEFANGLIMEGVL